MIQFEQVAIPKLGIHLTIRSRIAKNRHLKKGKIVSPDELAIQLAAHSEIWSPGLTNGHSTKPNRCPQAGQ